MIVEEGEAGATMAAGEDVSGFRYLGFDNGLKLYHQPELDLLLVRGSRELRTGADGWADQL